MGGKCYVSFSGGKDSTVLADLAAKVCKALNYKLILWFSDTGLEYPEIRQNVDKVANYIRDKYNIEVELIKDYPKDKNGKRITFRRVIEENGYPLVSKVVSRRVYYSRKWLETKKFGQSDYLWLTEPHFKKDGTPSYFDSRKWRFLIHFPFKISYKCCDIMKKRPAHEFTKKTGNMPITGTMASEGCLREAGWIKTGCNAFNGKKSKSMPMSFWLEQDVLQYIVKYNLPLAAPYGKIKQNKNGKYYITGCNRTGCIFCGFGCHLEKEPNRFQRLKETHPKLYDYCMKPWEEGGLNMAEVLDCLGVKH